MVTREELFSQYLLEGVNVDMAVDGSTPKTYKYTVQPSEMLLLTRGMLVIEDGSVAFLPGNFGALGAALANGIEISYTTKAKGKVIVELWKTNREIRDTMFDLDQTFKSAGVYTGRWTFSKDLSSDGLELHPGDIFEIKIQDNLTALDYLSFKIKGKLTVAE